MFEGDRDIRIGSSSWSSKDWSGVFYPEKLASNQYISHYSTVYDAVEIDATYYRMPTQTNVSAWRERTPEGFIFAAKTPRIITHEKLLVDAVADMEEFVSIMSGLGDKLGPLLIQFPYLNRQKISDPNIFFERLDSFLGQIPKDFRYVVEVRNKNWVCPSLHQILKQHKVALAWVEQAWMPKAPQWPNLWPSQTADFSYIRLLGDHKKIEEVTKNWSEIVWDRDKETAEWAKVMSDLHKGGQEVFGFFNNHFAGHAPASIELFRKIWREQQAT